MARATLMPERLRTFGTGSDKLELPVDVLGRARFRAPLERASVHVTRSADPTAEIPFGGTSILFNQRTWIGTAAGGFYEQIAPQAVTKTLLEADVRLLQNHNPDLLLARTNPQMRAEGTATLTLLATELGLKTEADMAPTSYARDLAILLERGDISQMSFAFDPIAWVRADLPDGNVLITVIELRLYDCSIVTYPAYEQTDAGLRGAVFDALCRSNALDPDAVMRGYLLGGDMPDVRTDTPATRAIPPAPSSEQLKRARLITPQKRSLNGWTLSDLWPILDDAIVDLCSSPDFNAYWYVYLYDVTDEWLVYVDDRPGSSWSFWQCTYSVDADGAITLGTPVKVVLKTTYVADPNADADDVEEPELVVDEDDLDTEMSARAPDATRGDGAPATATRDSQPASTTGTEDGDREARFAEIQDNARSMRFAELRGEA